MNDELDFEMIPEIKADIKFLKYLSLKNLGFTGAGAGIGFIMSAMVYSDFSFAFILYNAVIGFILSLPSPFNKEKCMYQTLLYFLKGLKKKKITYRTVDVKPYDDDIVKENIFMYSDVKELSDIE